jgi:serine/threonine protein kinase
VTTCPKCGTQYPADVRFCTKDGSRLDGGAAPAAAKNTPGPSAETLVAPGVPRPATPSSIPRIDFTKMAGQVLDGRYKIIKKIGEGGMSYVYLAQDAKGQNVAVKVLSPALAQDRNAMARLKREAQVGMRLAHANVCHIMHFGEERGLVYIVMPYVAGEILSDRNNRMGHLPLDMTVRFVSEIAAGLQVAHQLKIVHRDLKPENIMICPGPDGTERAVVMDFGLAKERSVGAEVQKLTATGIVLGTPEFMSPEQLRGKPLDPRTDVYSLALMTFEMLTGKLPFMGRTQQDVMIARLKGEPIPLRQVKPELNFSAAVESVLLKGMAREPDQRYQTAPEFADALALAARGGPGPTSQSITGKMLGKILGR